MHDNPGKPGTPVSAGDQLQGVLRTSSYNRQLLSSSIQRGVVSLPNLAAISHCHELA